MPDSIKFHMGEKSFTMGPSELSLFKASLVRADHEYSVATGRNPTHLILGQLDYAKLLAMIELMKLNGEIGHYATLYGKTTQWNGLTLLQSHKDELILAAEITEKT